MASGPPPGDEAVEVRDKPGCRMCKCYGATVYSRAMLDAGRPAACVGVPKRADGLEVEPAALPPDVAPGGDFKFLCLGVGVFNERPDGGGPGAAAAGSGPTSSSAAAAGPAAAHAGTVDDGVELPQCVGVQIIRAQAVQQAPATLAADAGSGGAAAGESRPPRRDPRTRTGPLPAPDGASLSQLAERFDKAAHKVVKHMGENADAIAEAAKKVLGAFGDAVFGRGR